MAERIEPAERGVGPARFEQKRIHAPVEIVSAARDDHGPPHPVEWPGEIVGREAGMRDSAITRLGHRERSIGEFGGERNESRHPPTLSNRLGSR
ncbi:hypothetical protein GCM10009617_02440 [Leifsonia poae]